MQSTVYAVKQALKLAFATSRVRGVAEVHKLLLTEDEIQALAWAVCLYPWANYTNMVLNYVRDRDKSSPGIA